MPTFDTNNTITDYTNITLNPCTTTCGNIYSDYCDIAYMTTKYANMATMADLEKFAHKIYDIITNHVALDISEEEFMNMLEIE